MQLAETLGQFDPLYSLKSGYVYSMLTIDVFADVTEVRTVYQLGPLWMSHGRLAIFLASPNSIQAS